jgi:FMN reductase
MTRVAAVVGNPNAGGRTTTVARAVADAVAAAVGGADVEVVELADVAAHLFEWDNADLDAVTTRVADADVVVAACPTYKATYTGLLKAFLDRYGNDGLAGCVAVPVMVGAAPIHALAPEAYLRPLLVELGATVPSRGLYVLDSKMDALDETIAAWIESAGPQIAAHVARH